jgi:hypothetical protein
MLKLAFRNINVISALHFVEKALPWGAIRWEPACAHKECVPSPNKSLR